MGAEEGCLCKMEEREATGVLASVEEDRVRRAGAQSQLLSYFATQEDVESHTYSPSPTITGTVFSGRRHGDAGHPSTKLRCGLEATTNKAAEPPAHHPPV